MWKHRIPTGLAIAALGLMGAIGMLQIEPTPRHARDSRAVSDSVSGNVGLGNFLRGSLDMICLSNRHLEGGPLATPEVYRSRGHHTVEKLTWSSPSVTTWERGRPASTIETSSR